MGRVTIGKGPVMSLVTLRSIFPSMNYPVLSNTVWMLKFHPVVPEIREKGDKNGRQHVALWQDPTSARGSLNMDANAFICDWYNPYLIYKTKYTKRTCQILCRYWYILIPGTGTACMWHGNLFPPIPTLGAEKSYYIYFSFSPPMSVNTTNFSSSGRKHIIPNVYIFKRSLEYHRYICSVWRTPIFLMWSATPLLNILGRSNVWK